MVHILEADDLPVLISGGIVFLPNHIITRGDELPDECGNTLFSRPKRFTWTEGQRNREPSCSAAGVAESAKPARGNGKRCLRHHAAIREQRDELWGGSNRQRSAEVAGHRDFASLQSWCGTSFLFSPHQPRSTLFVHLLPLLVSGKISIETGPERSVDRPWTPKTRGFSWLDGAHKLR